jgi:RND family efflux transporter MFP subunit
MKRLAHRLHLLFILVLVAGLIGCAKQAQVSAFAPDVVKGVSVTTIAKQQVPNFFAAVGTIQALQSSAISSQIMARIESVRVQEGSRVRKGDVLLVLDESQAAAELRKAEAALAAAEQEVAAAESQQALAQSTLRRYQELYEKKSLAPQEFDEVKAREKASSARLALARAQKEQASAALQQARVNSGFTRIYAPFDGVVISKQAETGAMATPGSPLLVLENQNRFRVDAIVNESDIAWVKLQESVIAIVESAGMGEITGRVTQIVPAAASSSRSFIVKVELPPSPRLHSGVFARVRFPRGTTEIIAVPSAAIVRRPEGNGVFTVDQNLVAHLRLITLGRQYSAQQIEVLSGLSAGEVVVLQPQERDLEGKRIEAR